VALPEKNGFLGVLEDCVMREYALHRAMSLGEYGAVSFVRRLLRNWKARRRIVNLSNYDDYMLRDIGVSRGDIEWAAGLPLTVNAALALEERAFKRRHSGDSF
jgi:uncharacterized protein YjiS (DUF1127 family)